MLAAIFGNPTFVLITLLVVASAVADLATGIVGAILTKPETVRPGWQAWLGSLDVRVIARWNDEHLLRQVFPIVGGGIFVSFVNHVLGRFPDADPMVATGLSALVATAWVAIVGGAVLYVTKTLNSIQGNLSSAAARNKTVPPAS